MKLRPPRYNGALLKKLVAFQKSVQLLRLQLAGSKEEERLRFVGSFAKSGWNLWRSGRVQWGSGELTGKRLSFFHFSKGPTKKKNGLAAWEASLKRGGNCGVREQALARLYRHPDCKGHLRPPRKSTLLILRIVQFIIRLRPPNKLRVPLMFFSSYCINCHVRALSVNAGIGPG